MYAIFFLLEYKWTKKKKHIIINTVQLTIIFTPIYVFIYLFLRTHHDIIGFKHCVFIVDHFKLLFVICSLHDIPIRRCLLSNKIFHIMFLRV